MMEQWIGWNDMGADVKISLHEVTGLKWVKASWTDKDGDTFPYAIRVFMSDGSTCYMNHYMGSVADKADFAYYLKELAQFIRLEVEGLMGEENYDN